MPQLEDGYTRIADELLEALAHTRIPGQARQIFDVIVRKTYGFSKKVDHISLSQFCLATGMGKTHVSRAINKLLSMNMIIKKDNGHMITYAINKHYSTWKLLPKKVILSKKIIRVPQKDKKGSPKKGTTIDTTTIKTFTIYISLKQLASEEFLKTFEKWTKHRKEIKKPLTPTQAEAQLKKMDKMGIERAIAMMEHTIEKGWQGLREPESSGRNSDPDAKTRERARIIKEATDEHEGL